MTKEEIGKCKTDAIVIDGNICITKMLDYLLSLKKETERLFINKIVEYCVRMHAHNGSGFDLRIILNNLTCERNICKIIKFSKGITSMKIFNGYVFIDKNKSLPQYVYLRCRMTHLKYSLKKLGTTFKLQI